MEGFRRHARVPPSIDAFDGYLVDLDGVVWLGEAAIPASVDAIVGLRRRDKRIVFITNDPRGSRRDDAQRLRALGIDASPGDVLTSGAATAAVVADHAQGQAASVLVIGSPGLKNEVASVGLTLVDVAESRGAEYVIVGGYEDFSYDELRSAAAAVRDGAGFYATNADATFPMPDGPWPATGAILAAVEAASGKHATVIGKPQPLLFKMGRKLLGEGSRVAVVGDRLDTDVQGGHRAGLATILVLTGGTEQQALLDAAIRPEYVVRNLAALIDEKPGLGSASANAIRAAPGAAREAGRRPSR